VVSVRTRSAIGQIPEAVVIMASGNVAEADYPEADSDAFEPGAEIEIKAGYDHKNETIFKGVIVAKRMRVNSTKGPLLEVMARDKAIALTRARKTAFFEKKKDSDVISGIASDAGLSADVEATSSQGDQIQNDVTDWDFLRLLANRNGYVLWADAGKLMAKEPYTSASADLVVTLGADMLDFDARVDAQSLIASASGAAWSSVTQERVTGEGGTLPKATWGDKTSDKMAKALAERDHHVATPREVEADDLTTYAKARALQSALSAMQGSCTFRGSAKAKTGAMLEIKGVGERFGGTAFIGGITHAMKDGSWETEAMLGLDQNWASDMPGFGAPPAKSLATPIHGAQIGTVTKLTEDPDGKLRIKVNLVMIGEEGSEVWARFAQPYSSNNAGIQFMPEIGDEVIVVFLAGDPQAPVVVGSVHNGKAAQPITPEEENNTKVIVTRSDLRVEFDDDKKIITLKTPGGHSVVLDDEETAISLEDSNGNSIKMESSGITIDSAGSVTIKASSTVDIEATSDATVKGVNVTCDASATFKGSGGASAELAGGGQTKVTGAVVNIN
ncbi:MAG: type VI secretion system tip protein VgrG, partial [Litoreibacter sp.]|nr:type VI secretion system tip protein VgrG [Litoreibacter sp.]